MQRQKKSFLMCLLCLGFLSSEALDLTKINFSFQYNAAVLAKMAYRVTEVNENLEIYYQVESKLLDSLEHYYLLQETHASEAHDTLRTFRLDTIYRDEAFGSFKLTLAKPKKGLLLISLVGRDNELYYLADVTVSRQSGFPDFIPLSTKGIPLIQNYITDEKLLIRGQQTSYHVYSYLDDFGPADPAMGQMRPIAPSLAIDSSFSIIDSLDGLRDYHFYLLQIDSTAETGITLLKCPSYYPKHQRIEELIPPLTYITTENEIKTMTQAYSKKAFENFWMETYGTKFRAKNSIKAFYDRIEGANELFTDYKQGWETDRGIIYIVFGMPDDVVRTEQKEIWKYSDGVEFEFIRISTLFTSSMYSLRRDRSYEKLWYSKVGELRKGF